MFIISSSEHNDHHKGYLSNFSKIIEKNLRKMVRFIKTAVIGVNQPRTASTHQRKKLGQRVHLTAVPSSKLKATLWLVHRSGKTVRLPDSLSTHVSKVRTSIIGSISTYAVFIWRSAQLVRIQCKSMRLLRSTPGVPWYIRNIQIKKKIPILPPIETAPIRRSAVSHANPLISALSYYKLKSY